jgi:hypothetical protein
VLSGTAGVDRNSGLTGRGDGGGDRAPDCTELRKSSDGGSAFTSLTSVTKSPKISEVAVALTWDGWGSELTPKCRAEIDLMGE